MYSFKNNSRFCFVYILLWLGYFIFGRLYFLVFHFSKSTELTTSSQFKTFLYGLQLDVSLTAYLCIIPFLLLSFNGLIKIKVVAKIIRVYTALALAICTLLLAIDAGLYAAWGTRLDTTFLGYLNTPEVMLASTSNTQLVYGLLFWAISTFIFVTIFNFGIRNSFKKLNKNTIGSGVLTFIITGALILPIRGGLQTVPVNQSNVYFSKNMFANHAAVNGVWNFFNSISHVTSTKNVYKMFPSSVADAIIKKASKNLGTPNRDIKHILNTKKPNIILLIWESLPAKVVGVLGGEKDVTPHLNKLAEEGLLFTNFYGNGDRTDKAIPAILSGYYPQPRLKIMRMPSKTRSLPMLPKHLHKLGYNSAFYYGGDLNFGNMNTYLRNAAIETIVDGSAFDKKDWNSKWGAFDNVFLQRFTNDLKQPQKEPFFKIALTSTSHEPYELNDTYAFGQDTEENLFRSAHAYTDKEIGKFISFAKTQPWYKNTLIVIMADHGHTYPKHNGPFFAPKKFKIPMLWLGGALSPKGETINTLSSQVDFPYTLLDLLDSPNTDFKFSRHLFNNSKNQFVYYSFNRGFGALSNNSLYLFDYLADKEIKSYGLEASKLDSLGKAITQQSYKDFLSR